MSDSLPAAPAAPAPLAPPARPGDTGRFVYHDLMTTDPAASRAFYAGLVGWAMQTRDVQGTAYTDLRAGGRMFGGMLGLDPAHGAPSHWMSYVAVDDVPAACARTLGAGGQVLVPARAIPDGSGTFAVLRDATGSPLSVVHFTADLGEPAPDTAVGGAWWHELLATDVEASTRFYADVFGWEAQPMMTLPDGGTYYGFSHAGRTVGGLMKSVSPLPYSVWQLYLTVDDVDAALARAEQLGGAVAWPAMDVPGVGRMAGLVDATGAHLAIGRAEAA